MMTRPENFTTVYLLKSRIRTSMISMIISAICGIINITEAMSPANKEPWSHWLTAGFCFGLLVAIAMQKAISRWA